MTGSRLNKIDTDEYDELKQTGHELIRDDFEKEGTIDGYCKRWRYWLSWCDDRDDVDPWNVEKDDIRNYVRYLESKDQSPNSISARVSAVSVTYRIFKEENIVDSNPVKGFETADELDGKLVNQRTQVANDAGPWKQYETIEPEEFELMLKHVPEPRLRNQLLLKMMWQLMIRSQEVTTIKCDSEDSSEDSSEVVTGYGELEVQGHIVPEINMIKIRDAKKGKDDSDFWLESFYKDDIQYMLDRWMDKGRSDLSIHAKDSPYLFLTHQKPQMNPSHVSRIVKKSAKRADKNRGIDPASSEGIQEKITDDASGNRSRWKVTAHTLRRSAATYLANKTDYPIHMLADDLNHRSVETTRKKYVREDKDERRRRRQQIDVL